MKCSSHSSSDATAICIHCGRGVCDACQTESASGRIVCSATCLSALGLTEQAIDMIRTKSLIAARFTGYLCIASGLAFGLFAWVPIRGHIDWHLAILLLVFAVVFILGGVGYLRVANRKEPKSKGS